MRALFGVVLGLGVVGCGSATPADPCAMSACGADERCVASDGGSRCEPVLPAAVCNAGTSWSPGTRAFREVTDAWNVGGVLGGRISITDVDGDGFADVAVRTVGGRANDWTDGAPRTVWLLRNTGARFEDVTRDSGVLTPRQALPAGQTRPNETWATGDVDDDGDLDLYTGLTTGDRMLSRGETSELLLNDGAGHYTLASADLPLRQASAVDAPAGATFLDFDRDGHLDLFIGENAPQVGTNIQILQDRLYRGDGAGGFTEVTEAAGLLTLPWNDLTALNEARAHSRAWSSAACDLNGDGNPELLVASYGRAPNHLWRAVRAADGTVTYVNRSVASGYAYDANVDWTGDQMARCYCGANGGATDCVNVPRAQVQCTGSFAPTSWDPDTGTQPFRLGGNSGTTVCADLDSDGDLDLFTSEIKHWWAGQGADGSEILRNRGEPDVTFDRPGGAITGVVIPHPGGELGWDEGVILSNALDFDNDGRTDLYVGGTDYPGNYALLYHQGEGGVFTLVPVADWIEHNRAAGVVVADFDRDGDLDLLVGHSRARCAAGEPNDCYPTTNVRVFENVLGAQGNWVQLKLVGAPGTNRAAIGARVTVESGGRTFVQEVGGGFGHYGMQNDLVLHFGLGAGCEARVTVRWPDASLTTETLTLPAGHRFVLTQGQQPRVSRRPM